jgi:hypothetical protein
MEIRSIPIFNRPLKSVVVREALQPGTLSYSKNPVLRRVYNCLKKLELTPVFTRIVEVGIDAVQIPMVKLGFSSSRRFLLLTGFCL